MAALETLVLRAFLSVGRYRARVIRRGQKTMFDFREYVSGNSYEGFTRKGVVLTTRSELLQLRDILNEVLAIGVFAEESVAVPTQK